MSGAAETDRSPERIVAEIAKNQRERLRIARSTFNGHELLNLRIWVPKDGADDFIPTKAGFAIRLALLPELIAALAKAHEEAKAEGLLP